MGFDSAEHLAESLLSAPHYEVPAPEPQPETPQQKEDIEVWIYKYVPNDPHTHQHTHTCKEIPRVFINMVIQILFYHGYNMLTFLRMGNAYWCYNDDKHVVNCFDPCLS